MSPSDLLILTFAVVRLVGSLGAIFLALQDRRWIVLAWGVIGVILAVPVAAIAFGYKIADLPLAAIVALHGFQTLAVGGATLSSRGEVRRLREVLQAAGIDPGRTDWRP